ncbi:hypothetical protein LM33_03395, partial [Salmonella enterica]
YTNAAQLQSLGITGDSDEKRRAAVDIGISRILQMQRDNGGFLPVSFLHLPAPPARAELCFRLLL